MKKIQGDEQNIVFKNPIGSVIEDKNGLIWCGFFKGEEGIFCLDPNSGNSRQYNLFPSKPKLARYNKILSLYEDRTGIIWIGTWLTGVLKLDKSKNQFRLLSNDPEFSPTSLIHLLFIQEYMTPRVLYGFVLKNLLINTI